MVIKHAFVLCLGIGTLTAFGAQQAAALPLPTALQRAALKVAPTAEALAGTDVDFSSIVALDNCSGSLVRFTGSKADDKAMVLTNGHCYEGGFLSPGQVLVGQDSSRTFSLLTPDGSSSLGTLSADQVLYATMTTTDVTLYRLTETYAELQTQYNAQALTIADHHGTAGAPIRVVSGFWKKIYSCTIDGFVFQLKEADWMWKDSLRYSEPGCEVIGGTSGSPVIQADTKEIVGINNTINENGDQCTENNPCEIDASGTVKVVQNVGYGQEIYWFYGCLNGANQLDLNTAGCQLPRPSSQD